MILWGLKLLQDFKLNIDAANFVDYLWLVMYGH